MKIFPMEFSAIEQCQALALLDEAERSVKAYEGDFTAPWLLSPINSGIWRVSKGSETRDIKGTLTNYYEYDWATTLYDGTNLIEPVNRHFLTGMQRLTFLVRELPGGPNTFTTFKGFLWSINLLARWAFLHGDILNPRLNIFTKFERHHFIDFFTELGKGGTVFVLRYPERLLQAVFPLALGRNPTQDELGAPLTLNSLDCQKITEWFQSRNEMARVDRSDGNEWAVKKTAIAALIGVDAKTVRGGPRWTAFLQQFSLSSITSSEINSFCISSNRRQFPSQRSLSLDDAREAGTSEKTLHKYFDDIKYMVALHRQLPDVCPDPSAFIPKELRQLMVEVSEVSGHTPWVPLNLALAYTTEALRWVHVYGDALVTLFLDAYKVLYEKQLLLSAPKPEKENPTVADYLTAFRAVSEARELYAMHLEIPSVLAPLSLNGWGGYFHLDGGKAFEKLQNRPSILDAIMILVGAITVVTGTVKPIRESEFRALKRDCILFVEGDGYWLSQDFRKKNMGDVRPVDARPIPAFAAKSLLLLRRLTDGLKEIISVTDPWLQDSLLTLPSFGRYEAVISGVVTSPQLNAFLDAFCDHVALPLQDKGYRWYLRVHEMRKSFLITFFWMYRYASLDAARWIAGHGDASHLYAYIQANFPGNELPGLEAEYASQVLRDYQQKGSTGEVKDVEEMHRAVCRHFEVHDVSWIDDDTLKDWLELQFGSGEFEIAPYSITNPDGGVTTEIAFRVTSKAIER